MKITRENLADIAKKHNDKIAGYKNLLMVCTGTGCVSSGGFAIKKELQKILTDKGIENDYLIIGTGCNGFCAAGPILVTQPDGIFYQKLKPENLEQIVDEHLVGGNPVEDFMYKHLDRTFKAQDEIPFFSKQYLIALRNKGLVDPEDIESYIARDGYKSLAKSLNGMSREDIINTVKRSGIRGRGGGGFPAGVKWESCVKAVEKTGNPPYLVCNADEGDPGAFMDRSIIETDPHSVIEGMLIAGYAIGATEGYVYVRKEYPLALERLEKALTDAHEHGLLGRNVMETDFSFDIKIHRGAGAFICGESSALMVSMTGRAGEPRAKYVHSVEQGYKDMPTVLNNVETLANIPVIIDKGGEWFGNIGTGDVSENPWNGSSGTKVFSLVGDITNSGLVEVPMGITLREIIYDIGGGIPNGREFKAVQTGGPSGGCLPAEMLDQPVDFDTLTKAGSMMGSGGMIVMDDRTCMVDIARYFIEFLKEESCGKCIPCREGLQIVYEILNRITEGEGKEDDLEILKSVCSTMSVSSLCDLGKSAPNPVLSTLRFFEDEYNAHIKDKKCLAGVCKALIKFEINDNCTGCMVCAKNCPVEVISGKSKELHVIDQSGCIKCGICNDVCKFDAVTVS